MDTLTSVLPGHLRAQYRGQQRDVPAWHNLPEYAIPSCHTLGDEGDAGIVFPTYWPQCGCQIPDTFLAWTEQHAKRWGRRFALAALMDRKYFDHCVQCHEIIKEHADRPSKPARREISGQELQSLVITDQGAGGAGFPGKVIGNSMVWLRSHWPPHVAEAFVQTMGAMMFLRAKGFGIILQGNTGCGKTSALGLIAEMEYRAYGLHAYTMVQGGGWQQSGPMRLRYITMSPLIDFLGVRYNEKSEWQQEFSVLCGVEHLFIDEFGVQAQDDRADMRLFELIDARYRNNRPTHIATNCDLEDSLQASERGKRLWDRLQEFPKFTVGTGSGRVPGAWREALRFDDGTPGNR